MNLDELTNGRCKHGWRWTSPIPCGPCIAERRGVWSDYGGFGYSTKESEGPVHCGMCWRALPRAELDTLVARAAERETYVRAFGGGPDETAEEQKRLRIDHCEACRAKCPKCATK